MSLHSDGVPASSGEHGRSIPIIESTLNSVRQTPNAGFGVFADKDITPRTELLTSSSPAAYVVYRQFRKEVCAWCFRYEWGRTWKVRFSESDLRKSRGRNVGISFDEGGPAETDSLQRPATSAFNGGGMVFDCESCRDNWIKEYGIMGLECFVAVEDFVQKQGRKRNEREGDDECGLKCPPGREEIDRAWESIEETASNVRDHRLLCGQQVSSIRAETSEPQTSPSDDRQEKLVLRKNRARATASVLRLPTPNPDLLFFVLSGILCRYNDSVSIGKGETQIPSQWSIMLNLCPSLTPYSSQSSLTETTHTHLQLLAILPIALLEDVILLSRSTIESILARDAGNSFGIWSAQGPLNNGQPRSSIRNDEARSAPKQLSDEDPEMLGFAIYPSASFFNHSCSPNIHKQRVGRSWIFSVGAAIVRADEELSITYIRGEEDTLPLAARRKRLEEGWGFVCKCSMCLAEEINGTIVGETHCEMISL